MTIEIRSIIWDDWNRQHIRKHSVKPREVLQVLSNKFVIKNSYRHRLMIKGKTNTNRKLNLILTPQDIDGKPFSAGVYYLITAYEPDK